MRSIERLFRPIHFLHIPVRREKKRREKKTREDAFDDFGLALGMIGIVACGASDALFVPFYRSGMFPFR